MHQGYRTKKFRKHLCVGCKRVNGVGTIELVGDGVVLLYTSNGLNRGNCI